jgi:hypothetical protein
MLPHQSWGDTLPCLPGRFNQTNELREEQLRNSAKTGLVSQLKLPRLAG